MKNLPPQKRQLLLTLLELEEETRRRRQKQSLVSGVKPPTFRGAGLEIQSYTGEPGADQAAEFVIAGPAETGKTWAALWRLDSLLRETPRANAVLARKLQVSIWGTVLVTYKRIQELRVKLGEQAATAYGGEKPEWYVYPNGSKLWVGGMDNTAKILSGERDWIYINQAEELNLEDWEVLLTRCTGRGAVTKTPMLFGDCNPGPEDHWILKRGTIRIFHSRHEDNPSLYDDAGNLTEQGRRSMATLDALTGIRRARLRDGKWVGAEGLFFEVWDDSLHTCEPFSIPADWPVWGALDYGFSHPTAFALFARDNDGKIYQIAEHVQNGWLVPQHCKAIRRQAALCGVDFRRIKPIVAGHDVFQQRGSADGKTIADQYRDAVDPDTGAPIGFPLEKATIDRVTGAQELLARLGNVEVNIKPTLQIFNTCKRTIAAITRMVKDPRDPEDVKKVDADINGDGGDDAYDALRYGVMVWRRPMPNVVPVAMTQQSAWRL